jgi:hypothetical protein
MMPPVDDDSSTIDVVGYSMPLVKQIGLNEYSASSVTERYLQELKSKGCLCRQIFRHTTLISGDRMPSL